MSGTDAGGPANGVATGRIAASDDPDDMVWMIGSEAERREIEGIMSTFDGRLTETEQLLDRVMARMGLG